MIKRFIKLIKDSKSVYEASVELRTRGFVNVPLIAEIDVGEIPGIYKKIQVIKDPIAVMANGFRVAMLTDESDRYAICVSDEFMSLSPNGKDFIINHELGHIINSHIASSIETLKRIFSRKVVTQELEADLYAVKTIGKEGVVSALRELMSLKDMSCHEIKLRIDYIQSLPEDSDNTEQKEAQA